MDAGDVEDVMSGICALERSLHLSPRNVTDNGILKEPMQIVGKLEIFLEKSLGRS